MPAASPTVATSGGNVHPVSHGDNARAIQPDGAIRNARPSAMAECGVDRIGASHAPSRRVHRTVVRVRAEAERQCHGQRRREYAGADA